MITIPIHIYCPLHLKGSECVCNNKPCTEQKPHFQIQSTLVHHLLGPEKS